MDLNSDLGEGMPRDIDDAMLRLATSANIACGGHAGDASTMRDTVRAALGLGVRLGAHPGYPDRENLGRIHVEMNAAQLVTSLYEQVEGLRRIAQEEGSRIEYLKPHGALYHDAMLDHGPAVEALWETAKAFAIPIMMLPGSALERFGTAATIHEGFCDRAYRPDGTLVPRAEPGALIADPAEAAAQALALAPRVRSLCVHADTPGAPQLLAAARRALEDAGYEIAAPGRRSP